MCQRPVTGTVGGDDEEWTRVPQAAWQREHGCKDKGLRNIVACSRNEDTLREAEAQRGHVLRWIWGGRQGQIPGILKCQAKEDRLYPVGEGRAVAGQV